MTWRWHEDDMKMTWSWHEVDMFWCEFLWVLMSSSHFLAFVWPRSWWICVNSFRHMEIRGFLGHERYSVFEILWDLDRYWMILTYCMILYDIVWYCMIAIDLLQFPQFSQGASIWDGESSSAVTELSEVSKHAQIILMQSRDRYNMYQ